MIFSPRALAAVLAVVALVPASLARASDDISAHVSAIAGRLTPRGASAAVPVEVVEKAAATAGVAGGQLVITTGLLALLESDAQLAMILAYEKARADRVTAAPPNTAGARRSSRPAEIADERSAAAGMRAVVAAGWDGRAALGAWDRLSDAVIGSEGGLGDARANARRRRAAARALAASGQRADPKAGYRIGQEAYRTEVLSHLQGWTLTGQKPAAPEAGPAPVPASAPAPVTPPPPPSPPSPSPSPGDTWLVYRRSGGFTGWSAEMRIGSDGSRWVSESQKKDEAGRRDRLTAADLASLRLMTEQAGARPPRAITAESKWLRDGILRSIEIPDGAGRKSVSLSDGLTLTNDDHALIRRLEEMLKTPR